MCYMYIYTICTYTLNHNAIIHTNTYSYNYYPQEAIIDLSPASPPHQAPPHLTTPQNTFTSENIMYMCLNIFKVNTHVCILHVCVYVV